MKIILSLFVWFTLFFLMSIPFLLSADCDMMALIRIQNNNFGYMQPGEGEFDDPFDFLNFLRSRSGTWDSEEPLNNDGYGIIYYQLGNQALTDQQKFYKTGFNTWYVPKLGEPMDVAEAAIMNRDSQAAIIMGHVRHGTGGYGSHPFTFRWNGKTYTFMHNGSVNQATKTAFMNYLGSDWFRMHPSNWEGIYGEVRSFIDSELYFHYIMAKTIARNGDLARGILEALNSENVVGINFRDQVFNASTILNFVLSDGNSVYVFRNSPYIETMHNLSYSIIDNQFIGIKTQGDLDFTLRRNELARFDQSGYITTTSMEITLPVELSFFNGSVSLDGTVTMRWQTASETDMTGFNLYRGNSTVFSGATMLNTELISATNDSNGSSYQYIDSETRPGDVYHYWLECVDMNGTISNIANFSVSIPNPGEPIIPPVSTTSLLQSYPNPFHNGNSTHIPVQIRNGDSGILSIYNVKGQKIRDYQVNTENNDITWDGTDSKGSLCSPGLFIVHLKTNEIDSSRKLLMIR